jgi:hypothetical protein
MRLSLLLASICLLFAACSRCNPGPAPTPDGATDAASDAGPTGSTATVTNRTDAATTVYLSFGTNSQAWPPCGDAGGCSFPLAPGASQPLPTAGLPLNATLAFGAVPGCGVSLAEFNFAIPGWSQDTANISLVNGQNANIEIDVSGYQTLGPTTSGSNATVYGVYPVACDICVARSQPPCGFDASGCTEAGSCGCKAGSQYSPTVPCQESFDAGAVVTIALVGH